MDQELLKKYLLMFQISIIIIAVSLGASIWLLTKIFPQVGVTISQSKQIQSLNDDLANKQNELAAIKAEKLAKEKLQQNVSEVKEFYRDIKNNGNTSTDILADELKEIHDLISYYGIKVYRENNEYDLESDPFYRSDKNKYSVCRMNLELFSTYMKFQSFLSDLYKHPHFLDIASVEINPYKKDKTILDIKMQIVIYAEKTMDNASTKAADRIENSEGIPHAAGAGSGNTDDAMDLNLNLDD